MSTLQKDMTSGNPGKIILNFTLPVLAGNIFQQLYNMADTVIVGRFVGTDALAAVGSTGTIIFLIIGFVSGITAGFTVLTAQKFGAGDMKAMRQTVGSAAVLSMIISMVLTILSMVFMKPLLQFMHTPADIFADAYTYIMIICAGISAQVLYNLLSSVLRALGNSKIPLYFLVFAALLNIVLDMALIIVFHLGAAGAAYATVAAQGASGILCLAYIVRKVPILHLEREDWKPKGRLVKNQLGVGIPMALQYSITAIGTMMVQTSLNLLGPVIVAAVTAGTKIEALVTQLFVALGTTMAAYCAQNTGAGKVKRIRQGFKAAMLISVGYAVISGALIMTVGKYLTYLFLSENAAEVMEAVDIYLKCIGGMFIPLAAVYVFRNGIQGMGYGLLPMTAGIVELFSRGAAALIAVEKKSYVGACLASPAAWVSAALFLVSVYYYIMKKKHRFAVSREPAATELLY